MTHSQIGNIVLNSQEMNSMNCNSSVVSMMNSVSSNVWVMNCSNHMEMKRVSSKLKCLSNLSKLCKFNSSSQRIISRRMKHDMSSILHLFSVFITLNDDWSCQKTNFSSDINFRTVFKCFNLRFMIVFKWSVNCNLSKISEVSYSSNSSLFSVETIIISWGDCNFITNFPTNFVDKFE